jgi:hypothetical protein
LQPCTGPLQKTRIFDKLVDQLVKLFITLALDATEGARVFIAPPRRTQNAPGEE